MLNNTPEFWPEMRQLGKLIEKGVQIVYLIVTLLLYTELKFINIIRISINDVYMFRALTSRPNIAYFVIKYAEGKFKRGDIIAVCKLIKQKLKEYAILAKIIIYNSSIVTT